MPNDGQIKFRCVDVRGVRYLRSEDVVSLIRDVAATEETDVRNRLNEFADNLERESKPKRGF